MVVLDLLMAMKGNGPLLEQNPDLVKPASSHPLWLRSLVWAAIVGRRCIGARSGRTDSGMSAADSPLSYRLIMILSQMIIF